MSTSSDIVLPENFDINLLTFGQPKALGTGAKAVYISYNGNPLILQTPPDMKAPFGISVWPSDNGGPDKYNLDVSFEGKDQRPPIKQLFDVLSAIDRRMVIVANDNAQGWFKKKFPSLDVVSALYTPTVKMSKDRDTGEITDRYPATFKMSLPRKDDDFIFPTYGSRREIIDLKQAIECGRTKGARAQALVQLSSVWIAGGKFGLSWKVKQLKLSEATRLEGYAFQKTAEDVEEPEPVAAAVAAPAAPARRSPAPAPAPEPVDDGLDAVADDDEAPPREKPAARVPAAVAQVPGRGKSAGSRALPTAAAGGLIESSEDDDELDL
jgi:hypothetical protein